MYHTFFEFCKVPSLFLNTTKAGWSPTKGYSMRASFSFTVEYFENIFLQLQRQLRHALQPLRGVSVAAK